MTQPLNILLLEDNPLDSELILQELRRAGFEANSRRVDNEKDYLAQLDTGLDLILSDFQMPQFNGLHALELLKERGFDIPFFLISGTIGEETAVEAMKQGATDYLLKDRLTRLGLAIRQALEQSRLRKERQAAKETLRLQEVALNAVSQGVLISDENRRTIYANTSFTTLTGYAESEILGRSCAILQGPDSDPETIQAIRAALTAGKPFEGEILNYHKDGTAFWNDLSIAPLRGEEGGPLRFIGIQRNVTRRKLAETALTESEFRYHSLFENMVEGYAFCRLIYEQGKAKDFVYLEVNSAFESLSGLKDVVGKKISDLAPGICESSPELFEIYSRVAMTGRTEKFEMHVPALERWFSISVYSSKNEHFIAVFDNITVRKQAHEELLWKTAFLEAQVNSSLDATIVVDQQGRKILQNQRTADLFQIPADIVDDPDDEKQIRWVTNITKDPVEFARGVVHLYAHPHETAHDEIALKDGTILDRYTFPVVGRDGKYYGRTWTFRDITERKRVEARLRRLVDSNTQGVFFWNTKGGITVGNDAFLKITGHTREDLAAGCINWLAMTPPEYTHLDRRALDELAATGTCSLYEKAWIRKDGSRVPILLGAAMFEDNPDDGVCFVLDITKRIQAEEKLREALAQEKELSQQARAGDRAKGEFLAVMSHEIRTPLNGILGFSELLAQTPDLPAESRNYVQTITSSGEALLRILNDVLDYSRLDTGLVQVEKAGFAPRDILGDIRALLSQQARDKELTFGVSVDEKIPRNLLGDAGRLRQILLNLTGNAIKFTDEGAVTLGLRRMLEDSEYEFFVKDTGCGIPAAQVEHLFQPFTQADSSISRRHGGVGLGLSISRRLAELLGGTLTVRSEPGKGSEFVLAITLGDAGPLPELTAPSQSLDSSFAAGNPLRILVVEDDKVNLKLMLTLVRRLGYEPLAARNGREAVEIQHHEHPDCVLMDLHMPEMDGIEATEKIRAREKSSHSVNSVFITALTANIVPADRQRCLDAGMNTYLNKPVKMAALAALLTEAGDYVACH